MKENILYCLDRWPGSRKREIASSLRVWQCDKIFLDTMSKLEKEGLIRRHPVNDPANMEFYDKWYLTDEGFHYLVGLGS